MTDPGFKWCANFLSPFRTTICDSNIYESTCLTKIATSIEDCKNPVTDPS